MNLDPSTLTGIHTILSLVAIAAGVAAVIGLFSARASGSGALTALFLATATAASATGFLFPYTTFGASHWVGVLSLVVLALAVVARYGFGLAGAWRWVYAGGVVSALYFLVFVGIAQSFAKAPGLKALAPTQTEPPFAIAQLATLAVFVVLGVVAARAFRHRTAYGMR